MYVCICEAVTEDEIRAAVDAGARSVDDVAERTGAGTNCGICREHLAALLDEVRGSAA